MFYLVSLQGLNPFHKCILVLAADCYGRSPPGVLQPSLDRLGRMIGCSAKAAWRALNVLEEAGWIRRDWRGGRKTNMYLPGPRLNRILTRHKRRH